MRRWLVSLGSETMLMTLVLWMCTLPLLALFILPVFGLNIAVGGAIALFLVDLAICWSVCSWKIYRGRP